jgi:branched-chain amino acid transport system substrate-binding protein
VPVRSATTAAASLLVPLLVAACSGDTEDGTVARGDRVATIGVIAPLSGDLAALGRGITNSVDLAIKQANENDAVPGWTLQLEAVDDQSSPGAGKDAATRLVDDDRVVGVVGTLGNSVARAAAPVLSSADVVMVSPANTATSLTRGDREAADPERPWPTYFRTCASDTAQGPFAARYLVEEAGVTKVATLADTRAYGQALVDGFTAEFEELGGEVVAAQAVDPEDGDAETDAVAGSLVEAEPQAVYFGGQFPQGAALARALESAGLDGPLVGGDGIYASGYIAAAAAAAEGDLATSVGAPADELESAAGFVDAYEDAGYTAGYEAYGPYAYDAAGAVIRALRDAVEGADSPLAARPAVVESMRDVAFEGATGPVSFDDHGDTTTRTVTMHVVEDGTWRVLESGRLD